MRLALAVLLVAVAGCKRQDMYTQRSLRSWDRSGLFADDSSMRHPVADTVARGAPAEDAPPPVRIDAALLQRGAERYGIACTPCHGRTGDGRGMIVQRGFPAPPSFLTGDLRHANAKVVYDAVTRGHGVMFSYADRVAAADRWAIAAYVRALQLSQDADVAQLPPEDRARLEAAR